MAKKAISITNTSFSCNQIRDRSFFKTIVGLNPGAVKSGPVYYENY